MRSLLAADARVAAIAHRLAASGVELCPATTPLSGLTLHAAAQYAPALRPSVRRVTGAGDRVTVLAVAPSGPAAAAGLRAGDALLAVGGEALPPAAATRRGDYAGVARAYALVDRALAAPAVAIRVARGADVLDLTLAPARGCTSRVQLLPSPRVGAKADGAVVSVTTGLLDFVANDDELALTIAHEMAHNVLGHRARLNAAGARRGLFGGYGSKTGAVRETERAADRLAYYLVNRAGYDIRAAEPFWNRLHRGPAAGTSARSAHPDLASRIADYRRAAADIAAGVRADASPNP